MRLRRSTSSWRSAVWRSAVCAMLTLTGTACGGDTADDLGVGATCKADSECRNVDGQPRQRCLTQFKGGYCGIEGCTSSTQCPKYSACVRHDDVRNYCFRTCLDKLECNANRAEADEANCSASVEYVDTNKDDVGKACVPPSSG